MILLTGASGFLGSSILEVGNARGLDFRTLGRTVLESNDHHRIDLTQETIPAAVFGGVRTVIHSAGLAHQFGSKADQRDRFFSVNAGAAEKVAAAAVGNKVEHFILISSMAVYGSGNERSWVESDPCQPEGHYAESKLAGENKVINTIQGTGCRLTILRMTTLYGDGDKGNVNRLIRAIDGRRFFRIGDGQNRKNLIYRTDAAAACLLAMSNAETSPVSFFNVASTPIRMAEVVEGICRNLDRRLPLRMPNSLVNGLGLVSRTMGHAGVIGRVYESVCKFARSDTIDGSKFLNTFGFRPKVELKEGLRRQVAEYLSGQKHKLNSE